MVIWGVRKFMWIILSIVLWCLTFCLCEVCIFGRQPLVSLLQGELSNAGTAGGRSLSADIADWNPFEDSTPFSQMTEDHIFGAEFDKIRRGSQSSKCFCVLTLLVCMRQTFCTLHMVSHNEWQTNFMIIWVHQNAFGKNWLLSLPGKCKRIIVSYLPEIRMQE